ncbi:hypothetical protein WA158_003518 [Blastocystis sp. Blastoise]
MSELQVLKNIIPSKSAKRYSIYYDMFLNYSKEHDEQNLKKKEVLLESYIQHLIDTNIKPKTIKTRLCAIYKMISANDNSVINQVTVERIKCALRNYTKICPPPKQTPFFSEEQCRQFLDFPYHDLKMVQLKACMVIAIHAGMRRSEIYDLKKKNIKFVAKGIEIIIERSKTDQVGEGFTAFIPKEEANDCKLYNIVKRYYDMLPGDPEGALFPCVTDGSFDLRRTGIKAIGDYPKMIATHLGLDHPEAYTGHCFRRTMATLAAEHGATSDDLMKQGRWKGHDVASHYVGNTEARRLEMAKKILPPSPKKHSADHVGVTFSSPRSGMNNLMSALFSNCTMTSTTININVVRQKEFSQTQTISQEYHI